MYANPPAEGVFAQVADGLIDRAGRELQPAGGEVPPGARSWRSRLHVVDTPDQAGAGHGERGAGQETGFGKRGDWLLAVEHQREQRAPPSEEVRLILVVGDEGPLPPPGQVAAAGRRTGPARVELAEVAAEVQQREVIKRYPGAGRERGQLSPWPGVARLGRPADGCEPVFAWLAGDMAAQRGQARQALDDGADSVRRCAPRLENASAAGPCTTSQGTAPSRRSTTRTAIPVILAGDRG